MAEKIPESLIDDILASTKKYEGIEDTVDDYSSAKIDDLVASILEEKTPKKEEPKTTVILDNKKEEPSLKESETVKPIKATEKEKIIKNPEIQKAEDIEGKVEEDKKTEKSNSILDSFNFKKKKSKPFVVKIADIEEIPNETEIKQENEDDNDEEIELLVEDDGQISLASDGEILAENIENEEDNTEETETQEETKSVSGQISIEKTRMFNEVKIRGEHNPNIPHNLGNKVTRTTTDETKPLYSPASPLDNEKYRKHFMNEPVQNLEKTQEHRKVLESLPQKTIETPGVVIRGDKNAKEDTNGFKPLPTLVSAEYELDNDKTRVISNIENKEDVSENQIVIEGFMDEDPIAIQSEEEAEAELKEARKDVVDEFIKNGIFKQEVDDDDVRFERQNVSVLREYFGPKDKDAITKIYLAEKKKLIVKIASLSVIGLIMAILSAFASAENGNFEIYGNNEFIYVGIQLVLLLIGCGISFRSFIETFKGIKKKTVDMNTVVTVSAFFGIFQCILGFAFTDSVESTAGIFAAAAFVPMILKSVGELLRNINDYENFLVISDGNDDIYAVQNIEDEDVSNEVARGLMLGNPDIKYSAKVGFPSKFVEISKTAEVTGKLLKIAIPCVVGIGVVAGIINGVLTKNAFAGISTITGMILMGLPVAAGLISSVNLRTSNKKLNDEGGFINGYSAVEDAINSNGVIVDACDAFLSGGCNIEGMKLYHKMRIDEAILYTASVIIESGGVLADIFNDVIIGKKQLLYPVEGLSYEEKLGCSCWINNHRVLVGNRDLLVHHNVETPDEELEKELKEKGKNVIFLAIEGKISAMFVVVYKANEETAKYLRKIEKDGVTIFFRTSDANITEDFIEEEFGLPSKVVKIINPVAGDMFLKTKNQVVERAEAKIIHNGNTKSMLHSLHTAFVMNNFINTSYIIQLVASFLGVAIIALLAFLSGLSQVSVWQIIIYQAIWTLVLSLLPKLRKN